MDRTDQWRLLLTCLSVALWGLSLVLVPFGTESPGILVLILVCSIGMIYPTIMPFGLLNYWYAWLIISNLTQRGSPRMGTSFLIVFGMCLVGLLADQYVMLGYYNNGQLRIGAVVWMLALGMAGVASVLGHPLRTSARRSARTEPGAVKSVNVNSAPGERSQ